jgi:hypothetical protein
MQALARFDVASRNQLLCDILQARIVADDKDGMKVIRSVAQDRDNRCGRCVIKALLEGRRNWPRKSLSDEFPSGAGARGGRTEDAVRLQLVTRHVSANLRRCGFAAWRKRSIMVAHAGQRSIGFGVAEQQKTAHKDNIDFMAQKV